MRDHYCAHGQEHHVCVCGQSIGHRDTEHAPEFARVTTSTDCDRGHCGQCDGWGSTAWRCEHACHTAARATGWAEGPGGGLLARLIAESFGRTQPTERKS